jgi:hypothetical protein
MRTRQPTTLDTKPPKPSCCVQKLLSFSQQLLPAELVNQTVIPTQKLNLMRLQKVAVHNLFVGFPNRPPPLLFSLFFLLLDVRHCIIYPFSQIGLSSSLLHHPSFSINIQNPTLCKIIISFAENTHILPPLSPSNKHTKTRWTSSCSHAKCWLRVCCC